MSYRPFIGAIKPHLWIDRNTHAKTPGLLIGGALGIAAHVTKAEAFLLANRLVDAAELLPDPERIEGDESK